MKKIILTTAILIMSIIAPRLSSAGETVTNKIAFLPIIVLGAALTGAAYVVYAYEKNNNNVVIPKLILQSSPDHHTWTSIFTNYNVRLNGTNRVEIFRQQIDSDPQRDSSFYRTVTP